MKKIKKIVMTMLVGTACFLIGCKANINNGLEMLEAGKYEEAIVCFEKDIEEKKNLKEAYRGIGIAQFELQDYQESLESFEKALENETEENATIYNFLGTGYLKLKNYEEALENYKKALEQEDCTVELKQEILWNEIAIYQEIGDWDTVKEKVADYIEAYPEDTSIEKTVEFLESR